MGGSSSKPAPTLGTPLAPITLDTSKASYSADYIERLTKDASAALASTQQQAASTLASANSQLSSASWTIFWFKMGGIFIGLVVVALIGIAIYDSIACQWNGRQILFRIPGPCNTPMGSAGPAPVAPSGSTGATGAGAVAGPQKSSGPMKSGAPPVPQTSSVPSPRPILHDWYYGSASGSLMSSMHDSTSGTSIPSSSAPLPSEGQGAYGIQWWMFVKDWNYGYGKEKVVLSRPDPSNVAIMNPKVTLAPTENNLKVSVSIFPSGQDGSSKSEPAPANNSDATDDVFVCEVPNIPLQSWFSVSMTVFDRNLDIYINGNLVKSCFLPGVPKPAAGNIDISNDGGFSGYMCDLNHYGKALLPSDAQSFYNSGTSCSNQSGSAGPSGGYSVKFGVYDTKGKEVKEYTF
jgi:hypothetical protein